MTHTITREAGNTSYIDITIPWIRVKDTYDKVYTAVLAEIELPGFRKGKAPKELAEKQVNKTKVIEEVLRALLPQVYAEVIDKEKIHPIITPQIEIKEAEMLKDWKVRFSTCEAPTVDLGNYKDAVGKLAQDTGSKIWVPGEKKEEKPQGPTLAQVLETLLKTVKVALSPLLIEQEVNRMLSQLVNDVQKLGMTLEQYLAAQKKNSEGLREEYQKKAQETLILEFALEKIADEEQVTVEQAEIDDVIKNAKTPEEKQALESQRYYVGGIIRRQKTLKLLSELPSKGPQITTV